MRESRWWSADHGDRGRDSTGFTPSRANGERTGQPRAALVARQSVLLDPEQPDHAGVAGAAREGTGWLRAMGHRECSLARSRQRQHGLPRGTRTWRLLGGDPRKISLHPVRYLSVRSAMAPRALDPPLHHAVLSLDPARLVAARADLSVD